MCVPPLLTRRHVVEGLVVHAHAVQHVGHCSAGREGAVARWARQSERGVPVVVWWCTQRRHAGRLAHPKSPPKTGGGGSPGRRTRSAGQCHPHCPLLPSRLTPIHVSHVEQRLVGDDEGAQLAAQVAQAGVQGPALRQGGEGVSGVRSAVACRTWPGPAVSTRGMHQTSCRRRWAAAERVRAADAWILRLPPALP